MREMRMREHKNQSGQGRTSTNKLCRLTALLLVLVIATLPGIGSTLARFTSYAEESAGARVSKWIVDVAHAAEGGNLVAINKNDANPEGGYVFTVKSDSETSVRYDITVNGLKKGIDVVLCNDAETPEELAKYEYDDSYGLPETVVFTNAGTFAAGTQSENYVLKFFAGPEAGIETLTLKVGARFYQIEDFTEYSAPTAVAEGLIPEESGT